MTAIGTHIAATKRPGELGVHSVDHVVYAVPDASAAEQFHKHFGLDVRQQRHGLDLFTFGHSHRWATIVDGGVKTKKLHHVSFGVFEEDVAPLSVRLQEQRIERLDPPPGFSSNGVWFRDPDGNLVEIVVAEKSSPSDKPQLAVAPPSPGIGAAPKRSKAGGTRPTRFAHILLFTADVDRAVRFYVQALGLRLSDRSGSDIAFLHGIHGSDHHMIAFAKADGPGIHHTSWDVPTIHEVGLGAMQMADKGFSRGWGLGRHVLGSNYFHYVRDPWGSYAEYSCDMDFISSTVDWESGDHDGEDAFYVWGPNPPSDFGVNYELSGQ
jgi:catechol-2,3-dioxygenase